MLLFLELYLALIELRLGHRVLAQHKIVHFIVFLGHRSHFHIGAQGIFEARFVIFVITLDKAVTKFPPPVSEINPSLPVPSLK